MEGGLRKFPGRLKAARSPDPAPSLHGGRPYVIHDGWSRTPIFLHTCDGLHQCRFQNLCPEACRGTAQTPFPGLRTGTQSPTACRGGSRRWSGPGHSRRRKRQNPGPRVSRGQADRFGRRSGLNPAVDVHAEGGPGNVGAGRPADRAAKRSGDGRDVSLRGQRAAPALWPNHRLGSGIYDSGSRRFRRSGQPRSCPNRSHRDRQALSAQKDDCRPVQQMCQYPPIARRRAFCRIQSFRRISRRVDQTAGSV